MLDLFRDLYKAMESDNVGLVCTHFPLDYKPPDLESLRSSLSYSNLVDGLIAVAWLLKQDLEEAHAEHISRLGNALMRCCINQAREIVPLQTYKPVPVNDHSRKVVVGKLRDCINLLRVLKIGSENGDPFITQLESLSDAELAVFRTLIVPHMRRHFSEVGDEIREEAQTDNPASMYTVYQSDYSHKSYIYFYLPRNPLFIGDLIESSLFNAFSGGYTKEYEILERKRQGLSQAYADKFILLHSSLVHPGNLDLCASVFMQVIKPQELVQMSVIELEPAECRELRNKAREEIMASVDLKRFVQHTGIKCKKCKQETVVRLEKQTRSADEATTIEYTCSSCGHRWRVN